MHSILHPNSHSKNSGSTSTQRYIHSPLSTNLSSSSELPTTRPVLFPRLPPPPLLRQKKTLATKPSVSAVQSSKRCCPRSTRTTWERREAAGLPSKAEKYSRLYTKGCRI